MATPKRTRGGTALTLTTPTKSLRLIHGGTPQPVCDEVRDLYLLPPPWRVWSAMIVDLGTRSLRTPLIVTLEDFGSEFVATWHEVETFGSGATEAEALDALKDAIVALADDLADVSDDALGRLPRRWKRALAAVLVSDHA